MNNHAIEDGLARLGLEPLTESAVVDHVHPLFARVLARNEREIYLANHSLGRPLDQTADDTAACLRLWYEKMHDAWDDWLAELQAFRGRIALLIGAPRADCIVPKASAGQGLRTVLNTWDDAPRIVATRGEFDSIDFILKQYEARQRARIRWVEAESDGDYDVAAIRDAIDADTDLVVISHVYFGSGQVLADLPALVAHAHACGARVLLDVYHSCGVLPLDVAALDVDFAIGGSYKYLRGGPGACWLYLHPRHLDGALSTLDTGWFAKRDRFQYARGDAPEFAQGGDAFLESTPAVLPLYQARAGQQFTLAIGVERLRAYSLQQQGRLIAALARRGVAASGAQESRGAFVVVRDARAKELASRLRERGVITDARGEFVRLCPDVLTTDAELARAAEALGDVAAS